MSTVSSHNRVVLFVGMPGAGKSSCVSYLENKGYPSVYFGGVIIDEVKRRGLEVTQANEKAVREELRATIGKDVVAKRIAEQIDHLFAAGQHHVVADGLYSWAEYKFFKEHYGHHATIVAIVAPRHIRHERLAHRPVRPLNEQEAIARDYAEIENSEKGGPIANADYYVDNSQNIAQLEEQLDDLLREIDFYE